MTTPPSGLDELYCYDELDRLLGMQRGDLDLTAAPAIEDQTYAQGWTLDQLGNWTLFDDNGDEQSRDHNAVNEITAIDESDAQVAHDAAGNMIRMPSALDPADTHHAVYDAWNRMTSVWLDDGDGTFEPTGENADTLVASYEYDGQRRRIVSQVAQPFLPAGQPHDLTDFYFNESWQALETRVNGSVNPQTQYVMDLRYIDSLVVRFHDANAGSFGDMILNSSGCGGQARLLASGGRTHGQDVRAAEAPPARQPGSSAWIP